MTKHYIIWKLKDDVKDKDLCKMTIKKELEALEGVIPGLISMKILTNGLPSSAGDIMMDSAFEDAEHLSAYAKDPRHVKVADTYVRPNVSVRLSFDTEI